MTNDRFSKVAQDPRFAKIKRKETKINVDSRFKKMFTEKSFQTTSSAPFDKYGRRIKEKKNKDLSRLYHLEESEEIAEASEEESDLSPSSDSEGYLSLNEEDEICLQHPLAQDQDLIPHGSRTHRFAVTNLDWDIIKGQDLFKLFDSFKPTGGSVLSVKIYKSSFGKERMQIEGESGPTLAIAPSPEEQLAEDSEASKRACQIALKKYKLDKLRYYFAVVECDSMETASCIYDKCDGIEFEKSSNFLDLRFIPQEITFEEQDLESEFSNTGSLVYKPKDFSSSSLQNTAQKCAWDEDDVHRSTITKRNLSKAEIQDEDYAAFLASDDESEGEAEAERIARYKGIVADAPHSNTNPYHKDRAEWEDMEVTFTAGLLDEKQEQASLEQETPFESKVRKDKERRKEKKNLHKQKAQRRAEEQREEKGVSAEVLAALCSGSSASIPAGTAGLEDERFGAILKSADYALDPTHPAFKATDLNKELLKRKRRKAVE